MRPFGTRSCMPVRHGAARMRLSPVTYRFQHTGICPMCYRSTKANVHQRCGLAREAELRAKRQPRLTRKTMASMPSNT